MATPTINLEPLINAVNSLFSVIVNLLPIFAILGLIMGLIPAFMRLFERFMPTAE